MDQCCGNCKLYKPWDDTDHSVGECEWFREFARSGGILPESASWTGVEDDSPVMYDYEGTDCETWQAKDD